MSKQETNTQVETKEPIPGSPEYDEAMAAKAREAREEGGNPFDNEELKGQPVEKPTKPDNVPEKFWDAEKGEVNTEALLKSYGELEAGRSKQEEATKAEEPEGEKSKEQEGVETAVKAAGLDMDKLGETILKDGDITDSDYAAFEKIGLDRGFVKDVVGALVYRRNGEEAAAIEYIGGPEEKDGLLNWAAQNLSVEEINGYNEMLAGPNWRAAVDGMKASRASRAKNAGEPNLQSGHSTGNTGVVGYASAEEMRADIANPLYQEMTPNGEAFRRKVMQRRAVSTY